MINQDQLLECAILAAKAAGSHALDNWHRRDEVFKASRHDVKLQLDIECQAMAEKAIQSQFPDHHILGEESETRAAQDSDYEWIIDPIDGTVNFSHGMPNWCKARPKP